MADPRLILDSGGLSAIAHGDERALATALVARKRGLTYAIPAPVVAECITGKATDAVTNRVIKASRIIETTEPIARQAGKIRVAAKAQDKTIDAIIIASAAQHPQSLILTSDPADLTRLANEIPESVLHIVTVNKAFPGSG